MHNQSLFVKVVIWFMIFLMSVGFAALVIAPFMSGSSLFGGSDGRSATEELLQEARADVKRDRCTDEKDVPTGKRLDRCKDALLSVGSSYISLASPTQEDPEPPRDSQRNLDRAEDAYRAAYELDTKDADIAARYAGFLRDAGKSQEALDIWTTLVKANPKNEDYLIQKAGAQSQTQDLDGAIATYRLFLKRFPDSGQVEQIKEQIKTLQDQKKEQANGGGASALGGAGSAPITIN